MDFEFRERVVYAFGHLVSAWSESADAAASGELGQDVMTELGLRDRERELVELLADHVAGNYNYHGEAELFTQAAKRGEV